MLVETCTSTNQRPQALWAQYSLAVGLITVVACGRTSLAEEAVDARIGVPQLMEPQVGAYLRGPSSSLALRWQEVSEAETYQAQLTSECRFDFDGSCKYSAGTKFTTATPSLESIGDWEMAATPPVGTRLFWRVRACVERACGAWSKSRYFSIDRQVQDIDGDGRAELVVGADGAYPGTKLTGTVRLIASNGRELFEKLKLQGAEPGEAFGSRIADAADYDGDGFGDVVVMSRGATPLSALWGAANPAAVVAIPTLPADQIVGVDTVGDIDGDGTSEIGVIASVKGTRCLHVMGLAKGRRTFEARGEPICGSNGFGYAIVGGEDIDNDGTQDLLMTEVDEHDASGVHLLTWAGPTPVVRTIATSDSETVFGVALAGPYQGHEHFLVGSWGVGPEHRGEVFDLDLTSSALVALATGTAGRFLGLSIAVDKRSGE